MRDRAAIPLVRARFRDRRFVSGDCFVQARLGIEFVLLDAGSELFLDYFLNGGGCPRNDLLYWGLASSSRDWVLECVVLDAIWLVFLDLTF